MQHVDAGSTISQHLHALVTEDSLPSLHLKELRLLSVQSHVKNSFSLPLLFLSSPSTLTVG